MSLKRIDHSALVLGLLVLGVFFGIAFSQEKTPTLAPPKPMTQSISIGFDVTVVDPEEVQLVVYTMKGCVPCERLKDVLQKLCPKRNWQYTFRDSSEVSEEQKLGMKLSTYPTSYVFYQGKAVGRVEGFIEEPQAERWVADSLASSSQVGSIRWLKVWAAIQPLASPLPQYKEDVDAYVDSKKEPIATEMKKQLKLYLPSRTDNR